MSCLGNSTAVQERDNSFVVGIAKRSGAVAVYETYVVVGFMVPSKA